MHVALHWWNNMHVYVQTPACKERAPQVKSHAIAAKAPRYVCVYVLFEIDCSVYKLHRMHGFVFCACLSVRLSVCARVRVYIYIHIHACTHACMCATCASSDSSSQICIHPHSIRDMSAHIQTKTLVRISYECACMFEYTIIYLSDQWLIFACFACIENESALHKH